MILSLDLKVVMVLLRHNRDHQLLFSQLTCRKQEVTDCSLPAAQTDSESC